MATDARACTTIAVLRYASGHIAHLHINCVRVCNCDVRSLREIDASSTKRPRNGHCCAGAARDVKRIGCPRNRNGEERQCRRAQASG